MQRHHLAVIPAVIIVAAFLPVAHTSASAASLHPPFAKKWAQRTGRLETLVNASGVLYYASDGAVGAVDAATGRPRWEHKVGPLYWRPQAAYGDGVVYADASGSVILALSAGTGKTLWQRKVESDYSHPLAVRGGKLYCQLDRKYLGAIDTKTHKTLWKYDLSLGGRENAFNIDTPPIIAENGRVLVGVDEHPDGDGVERVLQVLCLSPAGKAVWRRQFSMDGSAWVEQLERAGGVVYASLRRERLVAMDAGSGNILWDVRVPCDRFAVSGGRVVALGHGAVHDIDPSTGTVRWTTRIVRERNVDLSGPIMQGGNSIVLTGSDTLSEAVGVGPDGAVRWRSELPAVHLSGPVVALPSGFIASGWSLYRFDTGASSAIPATSAERKALAAKLVKRFDKLSEGEKFRLAALGSDALPALLTLLHDYALKQESASADMDDRGRFAEALKVATRVVRPTDTPALLKLVDTLPVSQEPLSAYADILRLLAAKGDDKLTTPLMIDVARRGSVPGLPGPFEAAMTVLARSTEPAAVDFLMVHLADTEGDIRETAYRSLARTGGEAGVAAVRKLQRPMLDLAGPARQVIAAAVESHYHFKDTNPLPVTVELPAGLTSFDMPTFSYITVREHGVALDYGSHTVRIAPPATDFDDAAYYPDDKAQPILWNFEKTKAKLGLKVFYDERTSSLFDVTVEKLGGDWLVTGYREIED
jgi:outer membrane protein assembly factor BamB